MLTIGSSTIGLALTHGIDGGLAAGRDEGDVLAVHRVGLAVKHRDAQIVHRKTGDDAVGQCLAHALFHRRHEHAGDDAALDHVDELEAGAARQRLDAQHHLAELAGAAALLLVAAVALGPARDGLAVGDLRRAGVEFQLVLLLHALQLGAQVHFAEAADHGLVGGGMALDLEAGVFELELVQDVEQALLVALAPGLHRQALHRLRKFERLQVDVVLVVRVVQHAVELDLVDLGDGADVAGQQRGHLDVVLALQPVQVGDLERAFGRPDEELRRPCESCPDAPGTRRPCR